MSITAETLMAVGVDRPEAVKYGPFFDPVMKRYGIVPLGHQAAFLAEGLHETLLLEKMTEDMYYSDPKRIASIFRTGFDLDRDKIVDPEEILAAQAYTRNPQKLANRVYARRMGNGDEASGDGWKFIGRGFFHLTGRNNYQAATDALTRNYIGHPELVAVSPEDTLLTACWFWARNSCGAALNQYGLDGVTRIINPAMQGAQERRDLYALCLRHIKD